MMFTWMKRYVPRGLYSRAALIMILPVVTLQLVVSVVFIQRHFAGVTEQMTRTTAREIVLLQHQPAAALPTLAEQLEITITPLSEAEAPEVHQRRWYDLTGIVVTSNFEQMLGNVRALLLPNDDDVDLILNGPDGPVRYSFDRRRVSATNAHQLFVNMLFFGGLMTLIAFIYMRNQLRPITRLAKAADAFGRGRSIPYRPAGAQEVRAAGHAFLDMRARIERHIQQRTMMLSGVSHDLRTPLTRLKLGLAFLEEEDRAPLERDVEDMQKMLDGFLSFSQGANDAPFEEVAAIPMVQQIVEDAQRANIAVDLREVDGDAATLVSLQPMAVRRAVTNLIENATRYGENAEVSVRLSDKMLRIRVEDDGPGIDPDHYSEAVKPFSRLDAARNQDQGGGVGLGLAIANDTARAHGGVLRLSRSAKMGGLCADIVIGR
ncbi:Osmolarity sensor protein EnvZ [Thalassovita autumnalis]|uniref:histidine kinase n=1 Tax=Thalassovita autumnalis TaxID=2072972 RepID=A0A0P1F916_9RHOB|nr:ATP-binding protein [Thalassovita autumnalis]CUH64661.1 Osmolarity sensor protein EnvZ [Thalassovita autumnalis]CUH70234.1 Osmolarity sensor protein EnvZ [Thalassovita autumnalis]